MRLCVNCTVSPKPVEISNTYIWFVVSGSDLESVLKLKEQGVEYAEKCRGQERRETSVSRHS